MYFVKMQLILDCYTCNIQALYRQKKSTVNLKISRISFRLQAFFVVVVVVVVFFIFFIFFFFFFFARNE